MVPRGTKRLSTRSASLISTYEKIVESPALQWHKHEENSEGEPFQDPTSCSISLSLSTIGTIFPSTSGTKPQVS